MRATADSLSRPVEKVPCSIKDGRVTIAFSSVQYMAWQEIFTYQGDSFAQLNPNYGLKRTEITSVVGRFQTHSVTSTQIWQMSEECKFQR